MKLWAVILNDLKILLRDRGALITLFLMPLGFIIPISLAMGGGDGYGVTASNRRTHLVVANYDGGQYAEEMIQSLQDSFFVETNIPLNSIGDLAGTPQCAQAGAACDEAAGLAWIKSSSRAALLILPEGMSSAIEAGEKVTVTLWYDPAGDSATIQQIQGVVKGVTIKISLNKQVVEGMNSFTDLTILAPAEFQQSVKEEASQPPAQDQQPAIGISKVSPENYTLKKTPDTYQQTVPGYMVMFIFFIIGYLAATVHDEKVNGTFRRLLSTPVNKATLLGGKMISAFIVGMLQVVIMLAVGRLMFGMGLGNDILALVLLSMALVASATAIGLAAAASKIGEGVLTAPLIVSALLGGCMFPIDMMPSFLRGLSYFVPHSWALTGYQNLMVRGQGLVDVLPQIGVLLGFALLFFLIAVRRFDFED